MTDPRGPEWRTPASGHTCGWPGCDEFIAGRLWGCRKHWLQVPMTLRDEYMEAGAGKAWNDPTPLHEIPAVIAVDTKINMWLLGVINKTFNDGTDQDIPDDAA